MDSQLLGLISIAIGLFLGLFFGLSGFRKGILGELSVIKEKVISIENTTGKVWDLVLARSEQLKTVERNFKNLGKVTISADPVENETIYRIRVEKPIIMRGMISVLSKETGLEEREIRMFKKVPTCTVLSKNEFVMHVPCLEPKLCTEYITIFLGWLDSKYFERYQSKLAEFEEPIAT